MTDPAKPALSVEQEARRARRQTLEEVIGKLREDKTGKQVTYAGEFALRRFADDLEAELKKEES